MISFINHYELYRFVCKKLKRKFKRKTKHLKINWSGNKKTQNLLSMGCLKKTCLHLSTGPWHLCKPDISTPNSIRAMVDEETDTWQSSPKTN